MHNCRDIIRIYNQCSLIRTKSIHNIQLNIAMLIVRGTTRGTDCNVNAAEIGYAKVGIIFIQTREE